MCTRGICSAFSRSSMALTCVFVICTSTQGGTFEGVGFFPDAPRQSLVRGVSDDGNVVIGGAATAVGGEAFRWTISDGLQGIGNIPNGHFGTSGWAISRDGSAVVGIAYLGDSITNRTFVAMRWTEFSGAQQIGDLPGGSLESKANAVSSNGLHVVGVGRGNAMNGETEAFLWTPGDGMVGLGDIPGGRLGSFARDITPDGRVIVGGGSSEFGPEAFRWTEESGMVGLGDLPGGPFNSIAQAISVDGKVIVGMAQTAPSAWMGEAFRWTEETGMVALSDFANDNLFFGASDVNADGTVVVGSAAFGWNTPNEVRGAAIWDATHGLRNLRQLLIDEHDLADEIDGWTLFTARAVSADGLVIVGTGINPDGFEEGWVANLRPVPEPSTLTLLALALLPLLSRRRRHCR